MLSQYNAVDIEHALRTAPPEPPFPPAGDRRAWQALGKALGDDHVAEMIRQADADAATPVPALPATLWLEYLRTGERTGYEVPQRRRRTALANLALAECLEGQGRLVDPIVDVVWAICDESSWSMPAHQAELTNMDRPVIDLMVAMTALNLAELDLLLGDRLDPALGRRIRYEVNRRCLTPYLTRHDHWWLYNTHLRSVNNWNAVCNGGVAGAAIYLEPDPARLAEILARALRSLDDFLATFDPDGGSSEGPGYWSFGFGHYTMLGHLIEHRTGGRVKCFQGDRIRQIAQFPLRMVLSPGRYVNFSDCNSNVSFNRAHLCFLAERLDLPALRNLEREQARQLGPLNWALRGLSWAPPVVSAEPFVPSRHDWFSGMMWMVARYDPTDPDALVLAAKGGHNAEMHNQNDVGNLIVHVGGESVIADIGRGRYTKSYFGPERYEHLATSSLGHSVPVVNGLAQSAGPRCAAALIDHHTDDATDSICLELKDAYPAEAGLASLRRTIALHRREPRGWVELTDEVGFASSPGRLESVLTTFGQVEVAHDSVTLRGQRGALRVRFEPSVVALTVDAVKGVDLAEGPTDVRRVIFALSKPATSGVIRLRIEPV